MRSWHAGRRPPRLGTAAALVAALLGAVSCTGTAAPPPTVADAGPATAAATGSPTAAPPPARVPDALRFTGTTLTGAAFDAAQLAGRPVVLWFWAPWCATCASQAWTVAEIAPKYRDTVPIVGVAGLGEQRAMKDFVTEFELAGTPQIDDRAGALWRRFKVTEQSTFLIIDRDGKVVHQGFLDGEALTARVTALAGA
ncbi:Thiol-disulfide isomerase or thioredoxin [Micromonospora coriariae]|uniref:Thiol-disulfide isomerase or thioredoxin n=1 Tax=Micromonospora coriariae TaxID=285665 RepID=A0A1C4WRB9_9ACTN|nr:redoxin domain-containing protein [Micromonospora coriariae]SCE98689.1 Thiol-disulfide isomerase or thioredoxin [Micromonospora coriariae]